jgi:hypothetical protein
VLAAAVADVVLVACGVPDDDKGLVDAVPDRDEPPPHPLSTAKAVSATVTAAERRRANASGFVASTANLPIPTSLRMLPPNAY